MTGNVAEEAAQLIEVEYEALPAVFDPLVAITEEAPQLHEGLGTIGVAGRRSLLTMSIRMTALVLGDIEQGFREPIRFSKTRLRRTCSPIIPRTTYSSVALNRPRRRELFTHGLAIDCLPYEAKSLRGDRGARRKNRHSRLCHGGDFGGKGALMDLPLCYFSARNGPPGSHDRDLSPKN